MEFLDFLTVVDTKTYAAGGTAYRVKTFCIYRPLITGPQLTGWSWRSLPLTCSTADTGGRPAVTGGSVKDPLKN